MAAFHCPLPLPFRGGTDEACGLIESHTTNTDANSTNHQCLQYEMGIESVGLLYIKYCTKMVDNMNVRTHLVRDDLTSSILRVQTEELSIRIAVVFCGFQREADHWLTGLKGCALGKVSQSNMQ